VSSDAWQAPDVSVTRLDEERSVDIERESRDDIDPPQDVEHSVEQQEQIEPPD
jgi:hypothetical protein